MPRSQGAQSENFPADEKTARSLNRPNVTSIILPQVALIHDYFQPIPEELMSPAVWISLLAVAISLITVFVAVSKNKKT